MYSAIDNFLHKILPTLIYDRFIGNWNKEGLKKYFKNTGWMLLGRILMFLTSFFTIIFVARYLGPENLGKLSYVQSLVAIFSMFASLGIDQIVYRDLVSHPEKEGEILGTAFFTKLIFGILTFFLTLITAFLLREESLIIWLIGIISLSFIFQPLSIFGHAFNARVLAKYPSIITITIAFLIPFLKILVILANKGIIYFAAILAFEALAIGLMYTYLYTTVLSKSLSSLSISWMTFKNLFRDSWPLMLVGVTGYLYARIDQVMIHHFIDSTSVGLYEVAVRLTEPLGFLPGVLISSLFPALINARASNYTEYKHRLRSLVKLCLGISLFLVTTISFLAPWIVGWLYGNEFNESINILRIYVWSNVGTIATLLMFQYFTAEHKTYMQLVYTLTGALLNIALNIILIPIWGTSGAALSTVLTTSSVVGLFLLSKRWL